MIRNIPIKYTDELLLLELEEFKGKFDCLYLPYDFLRLGNKGFAFINFSSPLHIISFFELFENRIWKYIDSKKICELNMANYQGIHEIKKHAKNYKEKKPLFFDLFNLKIEIELPMVNVCFNFRNIC
jgi:hypothetical protein